MIENSERDWYEDFAHENGNYAGHCGLCRRPFYGHKRRVVCRACAFQKVQSIENIAPNASEKSIWDIDFSEAMRGKRRGGA